MTHKVGVITTEAGSAKITGDENSLFKRYWKTGDSIIIKDTTTNPTHGFNVTQKSRLFQQT